jgi:hypothetical protein
MIKALQSLELPENYSEANLYLTDTFYLNVTDFDKRLQP